MLGYLGMPRRYHVYPQEFQALNVLSTAGASILAVGYLLPLLYLPWSFFRGRPAGPNPWGATGLEWQTASPARAHNFLDTPVVITGPYAYGTAAGGPGDAARAAGPGGPQVELFMFLYFASRSRAG